MNTLPPVFLDQMRQMLGDEYPAFLRALKELPALALRLNPRRNSAEGAAEPFIEGVVPWERTGRYLKPNAKPGAAIAHWAGAYYIQEASAMTAAAALAVRPGERVLDLCAAPGGKATQLAAALDGRGLLVANEPEPARAKVLAQNLERMGVSNAIVVSALPAQLARRWPEHFDAILVDAPCSGEGMFRRDPAAREEWNPASPEGCARRQAEILDQAARMLRPGGRLVYSTCTFNRQENEGTIAAFLERRPDFSPEDFELDGIGRSHSGMLRIFPHRLRGDGHFAARLRRAEGDHDADDNGDGSTRPKKGGVQGKAAPGDVIPELIRALEASTCRVDDLLTGATPVLQGDRLYAVPTSTPPMEGLRVLSPGLCLLRAGRSHVEPEHALAMALNPSAACRTADLDDARAIAWLAGEALPLADAERGWTLATWRSMPLGWGKFSDGVLKNHLPKGLRRTITNF